MTEAVSAYSVRRGSFADADTIASFNAAMAMESEGRNLDALRLRKGVQMLLEDKSRGEYWVAEERATGCLAGQLMLTREWSDWRAGDFWWIQSVYVSPKNRGKGVFRQLMEAIRQQARQSEGCVGLRLYVERDNTSAQEVYRKLGLSETGYVVMEDDWSRGT
ncbi:MAG: GNAT family N-acetyltransferase [Planctomyces sp.]|nr:GNAT family N-acetyltransferase [Planctomyces sp.]